jgi:hypothetical protein
MPTDSDVLFDVIFVSAMSLSGGFSIWFVYRGYRRCMTHLEAGENAAVMRKDIANLTFDALLAIGWAVVLGTIIANIARELRWLQIAILILVFVILGFLCVRPFQKLAER